MRQFHLGRHARKFRARHSRRRLPVLKLGLAAAVVVALAGTWLFLPFGRPDAASTQTPQSSSVPTAERTQGTTRSDPRPSLPVGKPLSTPSLLPPAATATPDAPTWAAPPGATGTTTSTPGSSATDPTTGNPATTGPTSGPTTAAGTTTTPPTTASSTTAGPTTAGPTTAGPTTAGPTTAGPTTGTPTTSSPTTSSSSPGTPTTSPSSTPTYKNCAEVRAAGKAPLYRGDPGYTPELDRNGDGVACERGSS